MERLVPLVYEDLARIARRQLRLEARGHTLATRELVHEAWLRIAEQKGVQWVDRRHLFALAAHVMRRVLVDHARRHHAARRGGPGRQAVPLDVLDHGLAVELSAGQRADVLIAVDQALERLGSVDVRLARVVECRFFAGLTEEETAAALGITARTVARDWVKARGLLYQALADEVA
jgi:RNA polymerase sigma factor (TIGR02999 family)